MALSPEGTTEKNLPISRPAGTCPMTDTSPALKRRATLRKSLRDRIRFAIARCPKSHCALCPVIPPSRIDRRIVRWQT